MCDTCCREGAQAGARCDHTGRDGFESRWETGRGSSRVNEELSAGDPTRPDRSSVHALCGGFVAGVILWGPVGGILGGLGAAGATSYMRKRNRRREFARGTAANIPAALTVPSPPLRPDRSDNDDVLSMSSSMTTEEAMIATGRAMSYGTQVTVATPLTTTTTTNTSSNSSLDDAGRRDAASCSRRGSDANAGDSRATVMGERDASGSDGDGSRRDNGASSLPSAELVEPNGSPRTPVQAIAFPCSSRFLRARGITAVMATPADRDGVVVGRPIRRDSMDVGDGDGDRGSRVMTAAHPSPENDDEEARLLLARISGAGSSDGRPRDPSSCDAVAIPSVVRTDDASERTGSLLGGGRWAASAGRQDDFTVGAFLERDEGERGAAGGNETREEDAWVGEEFEEDWGCIFDAYCDLDEDSTDGRLACLIAREPLQGSGVSGRIARRMLRMADWNGSGRLDRDEFALAMYLCRRHSLGERIPSRLEWSMVPPRLREVRGCRPNSPCPSIRPSQ